MSKEEERGLLSRMVRFVRNPSVSWSDLDHSEMDSVSRYSKQMLKDMIERRRRNDFVRKREFDMLRKLRRDNVAGSPEAGARASIFSTSSVHKADERAKTVKKINDIEAQMSEQWWKTKMGNAEAGGQRVDNPNTDFSLSFPSPVRPGDLKSAGITKPTDKAPDIAKKVAAGGQIDASPPVSSHFESTLVQSRSVQGNNLADAAPDQGSRNMDLGGNTAGFSNSSMDTVLGNDFTHDPLLEEAAIRFANGDDDGAESALLEALRNPDPAISGNEVIWMTLLDLYRATDQQESFESLSLDYANRFARSAPQWFSIPGSLRKHTPITTDSVQELEPHWKCPAKLDLQAMTVLSTKLTQAPQPWTLNWSALSSIDEAALNPLFRVFTNWADQSVKLRFLSADVLLDVLKNATIPGEGMVNALWWQARMQLLRVMHRPDEFEVVALDYCITYEVSPPSWDGALCNYKSMDGQHSYLSAPPTLLTDPLDIASSSLSADNFTETERITLAAMGGDISAVDLSGYIMGDAIEMLDALNAKLEGSNHIVVLCARLIRLDFLAAGALLNWVSARQAEGRKIHFKDLHRLVATFFNVIGINDHAKVTPRSD